MIDPTAFYNWSLAAFLNLFEWWKNEAPGIEGLIIEWAIEGAWMIDYHTIIREKCLIYEVTRVFA